MAEAVVGVGGGGVVAAAGERTEIEWRDEPRGVATRYWANGLLFKQWAFLLKT